MARRICASSGCRRWTPGPGREHCTTCKPDTIDSTSRDLEALAAAAVDAPDGAVTVLARRDDDPTQLKLVGRCGSCRVIVDHDTFDVPSDPESWAATYAQLLTCLHGHPVTVTWALISPFAEEAPARPRLHLTSRLGVLDG